MNEWTNFVRTFTFYFSTLLLDVFALCVCAHECLFLSTSGQVDCSLICVLGCFALFPVFPRCWPGVLMPVCHLVTRSLLYSQQICSSCCASSTDVWVPFAHVTCTAGNLGQCLQPLHCAQSVLAEKSLCTAFLYSTSLFCLFSLILVHIGKEQGQPVC